MRFKYNIIVTEFFGLTPHSAVPCSGMTGLAAWRQVSSGSVHGADSRPSRRNNG